MPVKSKDCGDMGAEERWLAQQAEAREKGRLREFPRMPPGSSRLACGSGSSPETPSVDRSK